MDKLELYKSFYDRENLRRETLNNSVSVPVGILTGLIAAIVFLITSFNYKSNLICTWVFILFVTLTIIIISISIVYLIKSFNNFVKGHKYFEIALLADIEKYYEELIKYYKNKTDKVEKDFKDYLNCEFIKYSDHNAGINDKRSFDLYKSKQFMFLSIVGIALVCIPFGFGMYRGSDKVTKVQSDREIHYSEIDSKIDSLLNVKLKQIENERSKSTTKDSSPSAKTTDRETSKRK